MLHRTVQWLCLRQIRSGREPPLTPIRLDMVVYVPIDDFERDAVYHYTIFMTYDGYSDSFELLFVVEYHREFDLD